jgi:hypothetical protein
MVVIRRAEHISAPCRSPAQVAAVVGCVDSSDRFLPGWAVQAEAASVDSAGKFLPGWGLAVLRS